MPESVVGQLWSVRPTLKMAATLQKVQGNGCAAVIAAQSASFWREVCSREILTAVAAHAEKMPIRLPTIL